MMRALLVGAVAAAGLALGGCTFSVSGGGDPTTVGSAKVADAAEGILEQKVGTRPDIDCGIDDFALAEGEKRTCTLTDPATGRRYDAVITLGGIDGATFRVDVDVADRPRAEGDPSPSPSSDPDATLVVGSDEIAATASSALKSQVEGAFQLICGNGDLEIRTGTVIDCVYSDADGDRDAPVTITSISGRTYELTVSVN